MKILKIILFSPVVFVLAFFSLFCVLGPITGVMLIMDDDLWPFAGMLSFFITIYFIFREINRPEKEQIVSTQSSLPKVNEKNTASKVITHTPLQSSSHSNDSYYHHEDDEYENDYIEDTDVCDLCNGIYSSTFIEIKGNRKCCGTCSEKQQKQFEELLKKHGFASKEELLAFFMY